MDTKTLEVYNQQAPTIVARHLAYGSHDMVFGSRVLAYFRPANPPQILGRAVVGIPIGSINRGFP